MSNDNIAGLPPGHRILQRHKFLSSSVPTELNAQDAEDFRLAREAAQNRGGCVPGGSDKGAT
jgi:hypothetical protein